MREAEINNTFNDSFLAERPNFSRCPAISALLCWRSDYTELK